MDPVLQKKKTIDITEHVKNLSVRYISTVMPTKHDLQDFVVLPLFQEGQEIPIESDGRTAIVLAHVPSLEQLLKSWHERNGNGDSPHEADQTTPSSSNATSAKRKRSLGEFVHEYSPRYEMPMSIIGVGEECNLEEMDISGSPATSDVDSPLGDSKRGLDQGIHNGKKCTASSAEDDTYLAQSRSLVVKQGLVNDGKSSTVTADSQRNKDLPEISNNVWDSYMKEQCDSSLLDFDPEDVEQMERQLAIIYAEKEEQADESPPAVNTDFLLESYRAAYYLEKELNGEAVDWTNYTETTLEANPLCVVKKVVETVETANEQTVDLPAPSSKSTKKHSASSAIKQKLLQDISEGRNIDIDATKAAAKRDDYRNTFCYQCRIDFYSPKGLYVHNLKTHPEGEVKCDVCLKPLKNRITLMKHKKLHLGAEDLQCICTYCGKKLKDKRALSVHITFTGHMNGVPKT